VTTSDSEATFLIDRDRIVIVGIECLRREPLHHTVVAGWSVRDGVVEEEGVCEQYRWSRTRRARYHWQCARHVFGRHLMPLLDYLAPEVNIPMKEGYNIRARWAFGDPVVGKMSCRRRLGRRLHKIAVIDEPSDRSVTISDCHDHWGSGHPRRHCESLTLGPDA
jgi:hypothetical protein